MLVVQTYNDLLRPLCDPWLEIPHILEENSPLMEAKWLFLATHPQLLGYVAIESLVLTGQRRDAADEIGHSARFLLQATGCRRIGGMRSRALQGRSQAAGERQVVRDYLLTTYSADFPDHLLATYNCEVSRNAPQAYVYSSYQEETREQLNKATRSPYPCRPC